MKHHVRCLLGFEAMAVAGIGGYQEPLRRLRARRRSREGLITAEAASLLRVSGLDPRIHSNRLARR